MIEFAAITSFLRDFCQKEIAFGRTRNVYHTLRKLFSLKYCSDYVSVSLRKIFETKLHFEYYFETNL